MKATQVLKNKKGFTLIEIIVVLIILAILAAAGIPSMLGFIDDARGKAFIAEARVGLVAAQMIVTETGGKATSDSMLKDDGDDKDRFNKLTAGITGDFKSITISSDKQVTRVVYYGGSKYYVTLDATTGDTTVGTEDPDEE